MSSCQLTINYAYRPYIGFKFYLFSTESGKTYSLNAITGEEVWSQATGKEVLYGLAIPEDYQEARCAAQTIHYMDELAMMEKIMSDMFDDEDGMEQIGEFDRKSGFYFIPKATLI